MAFGLDFDTKVFTEALEANVGAVFVVVLLGVRQLRETVLGNILGAYDAWLSRNPDSLARWWRFFGVVVVMFALAFDTNWSGC